MNVKIVSRPDNDNFAVVTTRTKIEQNEKQEQTIKNLCSVLKIATVYREWDNRGGKYYRPDHISFQYQSASNTILQLSEKLKD